MWVKIQERIHLLSLTSVLRDPHSPHAVLGGSCQFLSTKIFELFFQREHFEEIGELN